MKGLFGQNSPSSDFPNLQGPGVKGASTRASLEWVEEMAIRFDDGSPVAMHRRIVAESLLAWVRLVYRAGIVLTDAEYKEQFRYCLRCVRSYCWLAHEASMCGRLEWKLIGEELCKFRKVPHMQGPAVRNFANFAKFLTGR